MLCPNTEEAGGQAVTPSFPNPRSPILPSPKNHPSNQQPHRANNQGTGTHKAGRAGSSARPITNVGRVRVDAPKGVRVLYKVRGYQTMRTHLFAVETQRGFVGLPAFPFDSAAVPAWGELVGSWVVGEWGLHGGSLSGLESGCWVLWGGVGKRLLRGWLGGGWVGGGVWFVGGCGVPFWVTGCGLW